MTSYSWPGNIRELQNVVERAAILAKGPVLELEGSIGDGPGLGTTEPALPGQQTTSEASKGETAESLEDMQRLHILNTLKTTGGVVEGAHGAATILGLHPNTLRSRMKKLGIAMPSVDRNRPGSQYPRHGAHAVLRDVRRRGNADPSPNRALTRPALRNVVARGSSEGMSLQTTIFRSSSSE